MNIQPIIEGQYFPIYNRGVNGEDLFKERRNYYHFHLLVYINKNVEVPRTDGKEGMFRLNASRQIGHFLNSYAQSVNSCYKRTGPLFESPFERKLVDDEGYLLSVICYCNRNAVHHGFAEDIRNWEFSSYHSVLENDITIVAVDEVITRFGDINRFKEAHKDFIAEEKTEQYITEL